MLNSHHISPHSSANSPKTPLAAQRNAAASSSLLRPHTKKPNR